MLLQTKGFKFIQALTHGQIKWLEEKLCDNVVYWSTSDMSVSQCEWKECQGRILIMLHEAL